MRLKRKLVNMTLCAGIKLLPSLEIYKQKENKWIYHERNDELG